MTGESQRAELRDLGFRPYVGARSAPAHSVWVLAAYGLRRALASALVKIAVLLSPGPALVGFAAFGILGYLARHNPGQVVTPDLASYTARLSLVGTWLIAGTIALGAGATAIVEDRTRGAFVFYFTKPVLPRHYVIGRALSLVSFSFALQIVPTGLFVAAAAATQPTPEWVAALRAFVASCVVALAAAATTTSVSLAVSSALPSRALAAFGFTALWLFPLFGAWLASIVTEEALLSFASLPGLLSTLAGPLFSSASKASAKSALLAAVLLVAINGASLWLAHRNVTRAGGAT